MEKVKYIEGAIRAFSELHGFIQFLLLAIIFGGLAYFFTKLILNHLESSRINNSLERCASVIVDCRSAIQTNTEVIRDVVGRK